MGGIGDHTVIGVGLSIAVYPYRVKDIYYFEVQIYGERSGGQPDVTPIQVQQVVMHQLPADELAGELIDGSAGAELAVEEAAVINMVVDAYVARQQLRKCLPDILGILKHAHLAQHILELE